MCAGVVWNTRVAAGSDAYGYVSQADLWRQRQLFIDQSFAADVPWPLGRWTFTPLGYRPEPSGYRIVPAYAPGLPLLMAAAAALAGTCAMFWVVPLAGGVLTFATYAIGWRLRRPIVGLAAAWIVATSPTLLFMLMAPMSDVPAAAAWAAAIAFALGGQAIAAGVSVAIAILIRPNLVPLAAILAVWFLVAHDDERRARGTRRAFLSLRAQRVLRCTWYAAAASLGAIAVAIVNSRLYGSPLSSGYGDLSDAYAWSYVVPNVGRYVGWLVSADTPLAIGLPVVASWLREKERWMLAAMTAGAWVSYLLYAPWDAWWYLRFLLPAWPMMALGAASILAAVYRSGRPAMRVAALAAIVAAGIGGVVQAAQRDTFHEAEGESKYVEVANAVESISSPNDVIVSGQFSGSIRYYAGRLTLRWDYLDPRWLDRAVAWLAERGHRVYIVLEEPEMAPFRARFAGASTIGRADWVPLVEFRGRSIKLFDAINRDRFERPVEQPPLRVVRDCPPQRPPPRLR